MPGLETATTLATTHEVQLKPSLVTKLRRELRLYAELKTQLKVIESVLDKHKGVIGAIREETGEQSLKLDGFLITLVAPIRKKFNAMKFVELGGDVAIYNQAHEDVSGKAYERITCPGEKDGE